MTEASIRTRLVRGAGWATVLKITAGVLLFIDDALSAHLLGVSQVGTYFLTYSLVSVGTIFCLLGLDKAVVQEIVARLANNQKDIAWSYAKTSLSVVFVSTGALITLTISPVGHAVLRSAPKFLELTSLIVPLSCWLLVFSLQSLIAEIFRGYHDIRLASVFGGASRNVLMLLALLWLSITKKSASVLDIVWIAVGCTAISLAVAAILLLKRRMETRPQSAKAIEYFVVSSIPLMILSVSQLGIREMHLWVTASFSTSTEVSLFGAITRLSTLLGMPLVVAGGVIQSSIAELYAKCERDKLETLMQTSAAIVFFPGALVCIVLMVAPDTILSLVYGVQFRMAATALVIISFSQIINLFTGSPGILMMMSGRRISVMSVGLVSGLIGLLITSLLVTSMGHLGAAIGYASGIVIQNLLFWAYCSWIMQTKTHAAPRLLRGLTTKLFSAMCA